METWQEREVPIHIVLRAIEKVFDNYEKSSKKRTIKSLAFCSEEIEAQYEEWLESQVGKNNEEVEETEESSIFSRETILGHLENVYNELNNAKLKADNELKETLERVLNRLAEFKSNFTDAESLENDLNNLEKLLDETLLKNADEKLRNEIAEELKVYKKQMEAEVYVKTFELMLLKKLREKIDIPRISLFYL